MGKIGDVYYVVGLDTKGIPQLAKKEGAKAGDQFGKSFGGRMKANIGQTFAGTKGGFLGALGLGAGIGLATVALSKMTDVMGDAVAAALEEERSIAKLDAALRANVVGYDGNTDAIEKTLAARMRLGFADDEQRESLALLVAATGDYNKALAIQRTAMDLSRLKGISLAAASEALVKVEAGQFRILKSLGIQLPKNATAEQALAAVQKVATGQAEAYAKTNEGKLLASQIKVGEQLEKLGEKLLPVVVAAAEGAADAVEGLALVFAGFTGDLDDAAQAAKDAQDPMVGLGEILSDVFKARTDEAKTGVGELNDTLTDFVSDLIDAITPWDTWTLAVDDARKAQAEAAETAREAGRGIGVAASAAENLKEPVGEAADALEDMGDEGETAGRKLKKGADTAWVAWSDYATNLIGAARDTVTKAYDIIDDRAALSALNIEAAELAKVIATGKATAEQKARYREIGEEQQVLLLDLAENGVKSGKLVNTTMNQLRERLKTAVGQERKAILATIAAMEKLSAKAAYVRKQIQGIQNAMRPVGGPSGPQERHSGGPVQEGVPYVVGRTGAEELFVPDTSGYVYPDVPAGMGTSSTTNAGDVHIHLEDRVPVRSVRDIASVTKSLRRQGYF